MRAMALTDVCKIEIRDVAMPDLASDRDVRIRMGAVGVCGSDCHYYARGKIGTQVVRYPFTVGHEGAGVVEAVGAGVTRVKPGDRIAIDPGIACGQCDQCRVGRTHTCRHLSYMACPGQAPGCLAEYVVMPDECCYPLKADTTLEQAAVSEPLSIGLYAVLRSGLTQGATIGILGAGPIGLSVLLPAKAHGAGKAYVTDKIDARLAVARQGGADWTGNPDNEDIVAAVTQAEPQQLDLVFECSGDPEALAQAVELLKPGGRLMLLGIPEANTVTFDINHLRHKELDIRNVRRQNGCVQAALDLIEDGRIHVDFMITHRFPFDRVAEAFDMVTNYRDGVVKAMVTFGDSQ
jgi:L-iditol 2-dehydrogenase